MKLWFYIKQNQTLLLACWRSSPARQSQVYIPTLYFAIEVCPTIKSDVLSLQYVIDTCFRKIFNVKSKDVAHECETEFAVFPVTHVIDIRKKFLVKLA